MATQKGLITRPVTVAKVAAVLGVPSNNVGYLCSNEHGKIKIFNLHKPIAVGANEDTMLPLPMESDLFSRYYVNYPTAVPPAVAASRDYSWMIQGWTYTPPRKGKHWFRLTDFEGYDHGASEPAQMTVGAGVGEYTEGYDQNGGKSFTVRFSSDNAVPHPLDILHRVKRADTNDVFGTGQNWYLCAILFEAGAAAGKFITTSSVIDRTHDCTIELSGTVLGGKTYDQVLFCLCNKTITSTQYPLPGTASPVLSGAQFVPLPATLQGQFITALYPVPTGGGPISGGTEQITVGIWGFNNVNTRWIAGTHGMNPAGSSGAYQTILRSGTPVYNLQLGLMITNYTENDIADCVNVLFGSEGTGAALSIIQNGSFFTNEKVTLSKYRVTQVAAPVSDGSALASGGSATLAKYRTAYFVLDITTPSLPLAYNQGGTPNTDSPISFNFSGTVAGKEIKGDPDNSILWLTVNPRQY